MGVENIYASHVSELNNELDAQIADFKTRLVGREYPLLD